MKEKSVELSAARIEAARQSEWPMTMSEISAIIDDAFMIKIMEM